MNKTVFKGCITAAVTPFDNGAVDFASFSRMIDFQADAGVAGICVSGTTGEAPTLSFDEKTALFEFAVKHSNGRVPIIAGTGSNSTEIAVRLSLAAEECGCSAVLAVTPYYNKATPDGLYEHYRAISNSISIPVIAYNVPSRTGVDMPVHVTKKLYEDGIVCAVKEASGNISKVSQLLTECPDLAVFSGNDDLILPTLALGGVGVVSVISNILPNAVNGLCSAFFEGDTERARKIQFEFCRVNGLLYREVNPVPIKYLMSKRGMCKPIYRLPLTPPSKALAEELDALQFNV